MNINCNSRVHILFKQYNCNMRNIWEEFCYIKEVVNCSNITSYKMQSLTDKNYVTKDKKDIGGFQNRVRESSNYRSHIIDCVCLFEYYISDLVKIVYSLHPEILMRGGFENEKILELIIKFDTREKVIDYLIEEKVRSIFYKNPADILFKDKCHLNLKKTFEDSKYKEIEELFSELIALRNIIIHNQGRVDKKYIKETTQQNMKINKKAKIDDDYVRGSIALLIGLGAKITETVIESILKESANKNLKLQVQKFEFSVLNNRYKNLMNK